MCGVVGVATAVMFGLSADVIQRAAGVVFRVVIVIAVDAEIVAIVDLYVSTMEPTRTVDALILCPLWHVLVPRPVPDTVVLVGQHAGVEISEVEAGFVLVDVDVVGESAQLLVL